MDDGGGKALAQYYDREAAQRAKRPLEVFRAGIRNEFVAHLGAQGGHGQVVVDLGAGTGHDTAVLQSSGLVVVAADLSIGALTYCPKRRRVQASAAALPLRASSVGAIWSMSTMMHLETDAVPDVVDELRRVLIPGGSCWLGLWGANDGPIDLDVGNGLGVRHFNLQPIEFWTAMLSPVGRIDAAVVRARESHSGWSYYLLQLTRQ